MSLTSSLAHRGPDDEGFWYEEGDLVGLGHRRLSILDISDRGRQPMMSPCGRFVIVFNGEIYNFRELRAGLEGAGEQFASRGDTEVLLRLWARRGIDCLNDLRGMFAFAIWDRASEQLSLVRDPIGIKPLYYAHVGRTLCFASEVTALRRCGLAGDLDPAGIGAFLRWGSIPAPYTAFKGIRSLRPGTCISIPLASTEVKVKTYWTIADAWRESERITSGICGRDAIAEWTRQALLGTVRAHLVSDVPVGAFLSGGIDSAALVSLMREAGTGDIHTFSLGSTDRDLNESVEARAAAEHFGTIHHEKIVSYDDFKGLIPGFIAALDQPSIDGFNTYAVSRFAHENGIKVVVSGIGGDEIFRGYGRQFQRLPKVAGILERCSPTLRKMTASSLATILARRPAHRLRRAAGLLRTDPDLQSVYLWSRELFTCSEVNDLVSDVAFGAEASATDLQGCIAETLPFPAGAEANLSAYEMTRYLEPQLLRDSDQFSMAHSLELRTPLVDRVLLESLLALPPNYFHDSAGSSKPLLVGAARLPPSLTGSRKRGFALPFQDWSSSYRPGNGSGVLRSESAAEVHEQVRQGRRRWTSSWSLFVLERYLTLEVQV